jgi:hypothetical protein
MPRRTLTDRFCSGVKAREAEVQTDYFDEKTPGLALRVSRSGLKSWTYHFTHAGKRNRLTFGNYPAISLTAARTRADEARAAVAEGTDPRALKGEPCEASAKSIRSGKATSCEVRNGNSGRWNVTSTRPLARAQLVKSGVAKSSEYSVV